MVLMSFHVDSVPVASFPLAGGLAGGVACVDSCWAAKQTTDGRLRLKTVDNLDGKYREAQPRVWAGRNDLVSSDDSMAVMAPPQPTKITTLIIAAIVTSSLHTVTLRFPFQERLDYIRGIALVHRLIG
jgi:hypothetical protein